MTSYKKDVRKIIVVINTIIIIIFILAGVVAGYYLQKAIEPSHYGIWHDRAGMRHSPGVNTHPIGRFVAFIFGPIMGSLLGILCAWLIIIVAKLKYKDLDL